jgi:hypothetical protein
MAFPASSLIDRTKDWLRHLKQQSQFRSNEKSSDAGVPMYRAGLFSNAQDFTINSGHFVNATNATDIKINYVNAVVSGGHAGAYP